MNNPLLIKNFIAESAITQYRIVKFGTKDTKVAQASAATDVLLGVCDQPAGAAADERCDVIVLGASPVEYGGNVTCGDPLTADANGKAVKAAPEAGATSNILGIAAADGVDGQIGSVLIGRFQIKG